MSLVRKLRDWWRDIPEDIPLDYSQITNNLYIGAWPTKHDFETIKTLGVTLVISTILEQVDKELGEPPLKLLKLRMTDAFYWPLYPSGTLERGVEAALAAFEKGQTVMVFCKSGRHRSATLSSCILVAQGYTTDQAVQIVEENRPEADINPRLHQRIKKFEQYWLKHH